MLWDNMTPEQIAPGSPELEGRFAPLRTAVVRLMTIHNNMTTAI